MENPIKRSKWKPGQLVTIFGRVYRVTKVRPKKHPLLGSIWSPESPCIACCAQKAQIPMDVCEICVRNTDMACILKPIMPKKVNG